MTTTNFITYLQQLLTMLDAQNAYSVALAKQALSATIALAETSGKVDAITRRAMHRAEENFSLLAEHADDYIGKPGQYRENEQKRQRLKMMVIPYCG